jgi:LysR family transcriptional regulator, glycine cleavage system transcriptional activator
MYVVRSFIGVYGLEIDHVTHHRVVLRNPVSAVHVPRQPRNLQRLAAVVALIAHSSMRLKANPEGGGLSLAMLPTFGTRWLAPRLGDFLGAHPGITMHLGTRPNPFDFQRENFHAALHFGERNWPDTDQLLLFEERLVACCSPRLLRTYDLTGPGAMAAAPLLHLESRPRAWPAWFEHHGVARSTAPGMVLDQFATIVQAAAHDLGVALLPEYLAAMEISEGRLVAGPGSPVTGVGSYFLVWPQREADYPPLMSFRDWLVELTVGLAPCSLHETKTDEVS